MKNFKYKLVKNAVSKDVLDFMSDYFLLKNKVYRTLLEKKIIPPYLEHLFGQTEDAMVPGTNYAMYADLVGETMLQKIRKLVEKEIDLGRIVENYSYVRVYTRGNELKKHTDRDSCLISVTLPVSENNWPIFVDGKKFDLKIGDLLIYNGKLPHWREPLAEVQCIQLFLHYNSVTQLKENNQKAYDNRLHVGLPAHTTLKVK